MKIKKYSFLLLFFSISIPAMCSNCNVVFHLKNVDSSYYAYFIDENKILYLDSVAGEIDSFSVNLLEPQTILLIIANDTSRMLNFFVYSGRLEIWIDAIHIKESRFINSVLNEELFDLRRKDDSISTLVYTTQINNLFKTLSPLARDSIEKIYQKHLENLYKTIYKNGFKKTSSFITLQYIEFWLESILQKGSAAIFTKRQLKRLFNKLDKTMKTYPTYKKCEALFKQEVSKRPSVNEPLMK
ncbi:MAG: hypothetical protein U0X41_11265 [Chitinophagales bacterium]